MTSAMPVQDQGDPGIAMSTQARTDPLDYAWWASDGPTAGYLTRRALEALGDDEPQVRHVHLHVLGPSTAGAPLDISVTRARGAGGIGLSTVTYRQLGPFAIALLIVGDARGG